MNPTADEAKAVSPVTQLMFAYGSLRRPETQILVVGRKLGGTPDHLDGCIKSHFQHGDRKTYPVILTSMSGQGVDGIIFDVTEDDLKKIDHYQDDIYRREKVTLKSGKSAWTYVK